ncbi:MAG: site-2 protease family protein [Deltaproteobacteria bacterium]|nr:site-2 protease family protein [Deltaproteobacteria bacterium]
MLFGRPIQDTLLLIVPLFLSLTIHEYAHALVAYKLGDPTAKKLGRLTFNPFAHLSLTGTLCILLTSFIGWAKPVPVDPRHFKNPISGMSLVAAAGPLANILLAICMLILYKFFLSLGFHRSLPREIALPLVQMIKIGFVLNIGLAIFNLIPIPPLDGFRVVSFFLPPEWVAKCERVSFIVFLVFLLILMSTGIVSRAISSLVRFLLETFL